MKRRCLLNVVRWWVDGELAADYPQAKLPDELFSQFRWAPVWGGLGGVKQQEDYFWWDHISISGK